MKKFNGKLLMNVLSVVVSFIVLGFIVIYVFPQTIDVVTSILKRFIGGGSSIVSESGQLASASFDITAKAGKELVGVASDLASAGKEAVIRTAEIGIETTKSLGQEVIGSASDITMTAADVSTGVVSDIGSGLQKVVKPF